MDRSLRRAVLERLAAVEEMAVRTGSHLSVRLARTHLKTITDGWRELLIEHQPDLRGRCPVCSGWLRRRRWPCQVWVTAHEHLIGDGSDQTRSLAQKSALFRRPRRVEVIPRQVSAPTAADQSDADQPSADQRSADQPDCDQPSVIQPSVIQPSVIQPSVIQPSVIQPSAELTDPDETGVDQPGGPAEQDSREPTLNSTEIHRAAIVERQPTMPRSRLSWRSRA